MTNLEAEGKLLELILKQQKQIDWLRKWVLRLIEFAIGSMFWPWIMKNLLK